MLSLTAVLEEKCFDFIRLEAICFFSLLVLCIGILAFMKGNAFETDSLKTIPQTSAYTLQGLTGSFCGCGLSYRERVQCLEMLLQSVVKSALQNHGQTCLKLLQVPSGSRYNLQWPYCCSLVGPKTQHLGNGCS